MSDVPGNDLRKGREPTTEGIAVLVMEDDRYVPAAIRECLAPLGFSVTAARNAADAVRATLEKTYDVVVGGFDPSDPSGLEMCRRIADGPASPKVILMTACYDDRIWKEARLAGATRLVYGPLEIRTLAQAIQGAAMERRSEAQRLPMPSKPPHAGSPASAGDRS